MDDQALASLVVKVGLELSSELLHHQKVYPAFRDALDIWHTNACSNALNKDRTVNPAAEKNLLEYVIEWIQVFTYFKYENTVQTSREHFNVPANDTSFATLA